MAKEYIEREEAIEAIRAYKGYFQDQISTENIMLKLEAENVINDLETSDVAPVRHGKWESEENIFDDNTWICSVCHEPWVLIDGTPKDNYMHYCPNCGCRMDLEG